MGGGALGIWTSVAKMSAKKVFVMILHVVLNHTHVPVTVHVERACFEYMCARGLYTRLSASRHVTFHHRCIQSNVVMPRSETLYL